MRKTLIAMFVVALALVFGGLAYAAQAGDNSSMLTNGASMWKHITVDKPYTQWALWPGKGEMYKGRQPHGAFLTTYVSKEAKQAIEGKEGKFPQGSIIVKENYNSDKTLAAITVMYKDKGYNPQAGDWFWVKYKPDGTASAQGKVKGCIKCHSARADNDYVFTGSMK